LGLKFCAFFCKKRLKKAQKRGIMVKFSEIARDFAPLAFKIIKTALFLGRSLLNEVDFESFFANFHLNQFIFLQNCDIFAVYTIRAVKVLQNGVKQFLFLI